MCLHTHTYTKVGGGGQCPSFLTPQEVLLIPQRKTAEKHRGTGRIPLGVSNNSPSDFRKVTSPLSSSISSFIK